MQNPSNRAAPTEQLARNLAFPVPTHQSRAYGDSEDDMPLYRAMLEADDNDFLLPLRRSKSLGEYELSCLSDQSASGEQAYVSGLTVIEADEDGRMTVVRMSSMKRPWP